MLAQLSSFMTLFIAPVSIRPVVWHVKSDMSEVGHLSQYVLECTVYLLSMLIWNFISVKRYINTRKRYIPAYSKVVILTIVLEKDDWWQTRTQCLYSLLKVQHVVMNYFCIHVVMVSMLTLSAVVETKDFRVSFYCFSTKHTTLRSKIRIMIRCQSEVTCLPVDCCFSELAL